MTRRFQPGERCGPTVDDHDAKPEWDTATAHDLCDVCGWPVSLLAEGWAHDKKNPVLWTDKRKEANRG